MRSKFWVFMTVFGLSVAANASDQLALETVKKMYEMGKALEKGDDIIALYADENLSRAIQVQNNSEYCSDHDVMWQSNDPPFHRNVTYRSLGNNRVKVFLHPVPNYSAASLIYNFSCSDGVCKVSDIEEDYGSLVQTIYQNCT